MKIKNIVNLQGCYSAHDVGEKALPQGSFYKVLLTLKFAEEDTYKEGCDPNSANSTHLDLDIKGYTQEELINSIKSYFGVEREAIELNACEDKGRIDVQLMETEDGSSPNNVDMESWREGSLRLWAVNYSLYIGIVIPNIKL